MICKICQQPFDNKHPWRVHNLKLKDYIETYEQKLDLFSHEIIPFKNQTIEEYKEANFINKTNLLSYLKGLSKDKQKDFVKDLLLKRKIKKNLIYAPANFELRTLTIPTIYWFYKNLSPNSFNEICQEIGLINRFNYNEKLSFNNKINLINVDSREQNKLDFNYPSEIKGLNIGDYNCNNKPNLIIERKSINDAIGSFSGGYERFCKELDRAVINNDYLTVIIEERFANLKSFNYLPHCKFSKCTPEFILSRIREICIKYPLNCQFLCVDGRKEMVKVMENIFKLNNDIRYIDLDYHYSLGIL